jgi:hypothetical protein
MIEISRNPIGAASGGFMVEASLDANRAHPGVTPAFGIDLLVADEKRAGKIDVVIADRVQNHSRGRLATFGRLFWNIGAKIGGVDQVQADLTQNFRFHRTILFDGEESSSDSALVGDDDNLVTVLLQAKQGLRDAVKNAHLLWIGAIIGIMDEGAIAIDKHGPRPRVIRSHP